MIKNRIKKDGVVVTVSLLIRPESLGGNEKKQRSAVRKTRVESMSFFIDKDCATGYGPVTESLFTFCM